MNSVWFREYGFFSNPFSIKPAAFHDDVIGYDKLVDDISYAILKKKVVLLEGDYGNGKSTVLRRLLHDFGGKKQVIYYSCNRMDSRLNVKELLNGRYGWFGRLFDLKPKDMILFLDEAHELTVKDYQKLHSYAQEGYLKSVVLVAKELKKTEIPKEMQSNLEAFNLVALDGAMAIRIVRSRVGDLPLLPDIAIIKIFEKCGNNVRLLLKHCEDACKYATSMGKRKVDDDVLRAIFPDMKAAEKPKEAPKPVVEKKVDTIEIQPAPKVVEKPVPKPVEKPKVEVKPVERPKVEPKPLDKKKKEEEVRDDKKKEKRVYNPDQYKNMIHTSTEELLNKDTEELFGDDHYY